MNHQKQISCPTCGEQNTWHSENRFKPFCSDRCKLIDLGEWASDSRKIPGDPVANLPFSDHNASDSGDDY